MKKVSIAVIYKNSLVLSCSLCHLYNLQQFNNSHSHDITDEMRLIVYFESKSTTLIQRVKLAWDVLTRKNSPEFFI